MKIDDGLIQYLETLSRLSLSATEKEQAHRDLAEILNYMARLDSLQVDTLGEAATCRTSANASAYRDDVVEGSFDRTLLLSNAPVKNAEYFIAPKTVEI